MFEKILGSFANGKESISPPLTTKLFIPPVPPNYLERPRLKKLHEQMLTHKLTLVSAPAGYGKTTFVSHFLRSQQLPVAWISLDKRENDFGQFWTNVIAAIQKIKPGLATHENQILMNNEKQFDYRTLWSSSDVKETGIGKDSFKK